MQQQSKAIETRVRLRFDQLVSPHLHEIFASVDSSRHSTLVALMLERCVAYDRAYAGQSVGLIDTSQIQKGSIHAQGESVDKRRRVSNEISPPHASQPKTMTASESKALPSAAIAAPAIEPIQPAAANLYASSSDEIQEDSAPVHDPADMAMALGALGL